MTTTTNAAPAPAPNAAPKQALTPTPNGDLTLARAPGAESSEIEGADLEALRRFNKALPPETKRTDKPAAKKKDEEEEEKPAAEKDDEAAATAQQEGGANADDGTLLEADAGAGEAAAGGSSAGSGEGFSAAQVALGSLLFGGIAAAAGGGGGGSSSPAPNVAAVITGTASGTVTGGNDGAKASGDLDHTDVDGPDDVWQAGTLKSAYGSLTITADGKWVYTLDVADATVRALNADETLTDSVVVRTSDGTEKTVKITINGANDAPVITGDDTGSVTEKSGVLNATPGVATATGDLDHTDVDNDLANADDKWKAETVTGSYGALVIDAAGAWTYTLDDTNSSVQALNVGDTLTDTLTVETGDGTTKTVSITINGANDAATATFVTSDDGTFTISADDQDNVGRLTLAGNASSLFDNPPGTATSLVNDGNVNTTYTVKSQSAPTAYRVVVEDAAGAQSAVLNSEGDELVVSIGSALSNTLGPVESNQAAIYYGFGGNDTIRAGVNADTLYGGEGDDKFVVLGEILAGAFGSGSYSTWTDEALQAAIDAQGLTDVVTVAELRAANLASEAADGERIVGGAGNDTLYVFGSADLTNVDVDASVENLVLFSRIELTRAQLFELDTITLVGNSAHTIVITDLAPGETPEQAFGAWLQQVGQQLKLSRVGDQSSLSLTIGDGGTPKNAQEIFEFLANNGSPFSNELLSAVTTETLTDTASPDTFNSVIGTVTATPGGAAYSISGGGADSSRAGFDLSKAATYGTLYLNSNTGAYEYVPNGGVIEARIANDSESFNLLVTVGADVVGIETLAIDIVGVNDVPVVGNLPAALLGSVTESGHLDDGTVVSGTSSISGTLSATDVDAGAVLSWSIEGTPSTTYGTIAIDPSTGEWTYTLDNDLAATQALKEGESVTQTYTARVTDEFGASVDQTITVTINGTNDVPEVTNVATDLVGTVTEAGNEDDGDVVAGTVSVSGTLSATDVDADAVLTWSIEGTPSATYGTIAIDAATGVWTYTLGNELPATQALKEGASVTQSYTARVTDDKGAYVDQTIVVTINGTNDVPIISLETGDLATATLTDTSVADDLFASDTLTVRDVDLSDTVTASVVNSATDIVTSGPLGTLNNTALAGMFSLTGGSINANPSDANNLTWTFNPAAGAFDYLKNGESLAITYTVTVNDSKGGTDTQDITITIKGANDVRLTSYVSSTSSSFTITASDPDDTSLKLPGNPTTLFNDQNGNPTSVVNNGSPTTFTVVEQTTQTSYRVVVEDVPGAQTKVLNADGDEVVVSLGTTGGNVLHSVSSVQAGIYYGFDGNDTITGGVNADTIYGGTGNDTINAGTGNDFIAGEIGDDTLHGGGGQDTIYGGDGDDKIFWTNTTAGAGVTADGGDGNDYIDADTDDVGDDTLAGGRGNDIIYAGGGDDRIEGGEDNDTLKGEEGDDTLLGGDGNDSLEGGNGNDSLSGGSGDDTIKAGLGVDTIVSGAGADQISLDIGSSGESDYVVYQVSEVDGVQTAADSPAYGATTGYDVITGVETARDVLVFNQFKPGAGRKLDGTNGSSVWSNGGNVTITSTASVLAVENSAVAAGDSLTEDIAAALNAAFNLSSLKDGEEMLFSVKAANIDGDENTSQYWVGIFNNTVVDDANSAREIQVVALVTQVGSGGIDWDNFRKEVPSTPLIGGTPNTSSLSYDITPTDDATVTPFSNPVTDPDKTHFPITAGNRFKGATYVSDFVPGVTQLPVPPTFSSFGDNEVHHGQFEVYYGSCDSLTGIFTVTSTPYSPPSVPTSHTLILYDNDSTLNVEFIEGLVFDGFMQESSWSITEGGTANATLQFKPPANTLYGTPGADTLDGTASAELIQGLAANDSLSGGDGVDTIAGGAGDDTLVGGLGNDVLIGGVGNDTFSYASGDGLDTFKDFGVKDVYDTDFVTTSGNYNVVSATADPLAGLSLNISSATGAGVFQFTADFADELFNTGSVLDGKQMDALLRTIDSDGIVDLNATSGRFMLVMTDTSTDKSHLYQVVDTSGTDSRVGGGDVGGLTLVGIFEEMAAPWTNGYIA